MALGFLFHTVDHLGFLFHTGDESKGDVTAANTLEDVLRRGVRVRPPFMDFWSETNLLQGAHGEIP